MRRTEVSKLFLLASVLAVVTAAPAAAFKLLRWDGSLQGAPTWHRPTANLQEVSKGAATPYSVQSIWVDQSGLYQIDSDLPDTENPLPGGHVFLYTGTFDPNQPLLNLIAGSDGGPDTVAPGHIASVLMAGGIYQVVTTSDDPTAGRFRNDVYGYGAIHASNCAAHSGVAAGDANSIGLLGGRFCVTVTWTDAAGNTHVASPVAFRSDTSAGFWFFDPSNWELQVKVIDACKLNQHFWVMASGTTNIDYQVNVDDVTSQSSALRRSYHNKLGNTQGTFDTKAFDGCPAGAAARHR
jgi:hypothetical protein